MDALDNGGNVTPVLLLKTRSTPTDAYYDYFASGIQCQFEPTFLRVLEHRFNSDALRWLHLAITSGAFVDDRSLTDRNSTERFGGLIFTSQRAVEAFAEVVNGIDAAGRDRLLPGSLPLYVVGPATAKAVRAIGLSCSVLGEETGNGDVLADYILDDYRAVSASEQRLPLLFMVGEQRRDIIPKKLQDGSMPLKERIPVVEKTVYETAERQAFAAEFDQMLQRSIAQDVWVVVFSPTGCGAMLKVLGWLNAEGKYDAALAASKKRKVRIATIGPTTRDFLVRKFGYEPDVCADTPNPEGVGGGIYSFIDSIESR